MVADDEHEGPGPLPSGTVFGRYEIIRRIGSGGMASVYQARHMDLDKRVALKTLHPAFSRHEPSVERFLQEARAASRLVHPHVVNVSDVGLESGVPYLVMEFLEGETLASFIDRGGAMPPVLVADVMLPVLSAVSAAHAAGIVHRDLKPDNIFLARDLHGGDRPVLLDFGISKVLNAPTRVTALTAVGQMVGTPHYMSPEQVRAVEEIDGRSDQYALGVILYECVTGLRPYRTDQSLFLLMAEIVVGKPEPPSRFRPSIPPALDAMILRAMATKRDDRYPDVAALGKALLQLASPGARLRWSAEFGASSPAHAARSGAAPGDAGAQRGSSPTHGIATAVNPRGIASEASAPPGTLSPRPPRTAVPARPQDLRVIESLAGCSDSELEMFSVVTPTWHFPAGSVLFRQGAAGESCFLLLSGEVEVIKSLHSGESVLNTLRAGAVVGQIALVDRAPRSASVVAKSDTVAVELGRDVFQRLLDARSEIATRFQAQVAVAGIRQLRTATQTLATLLEDRATARAAGERPSLDPGNAERLGRVQAAVNEWDLPLGGEDADQTRRVRAPRR